MAKEADTTISVYLCSERGKMDDFIDLNCIREMLQKEKDVVDVSIYRELCTVEEITEVLKRYREFRPSRVLLGCCTTATSNRLRNLLIDEGLNKYLFEQINLKELVMMMQYSKDVATRKAISMLRGGIARLRAAKPLEDIVMPIRGSVLVIGRGISGIS